MATRTTIFRKGSPVRVYPTDASARKGGSSGEVGTVTSVRKTTKGKGPANRIRVKLDSGESVDVSRGRVRTYFGPSKMALTSGHPSWASRPASRPAAKKSVGGPDRARALAILKGVDRLIDELLTLPQEAIEAAQRKAANGPVKEWLVEFYYEYQ